MPELIEVEQYRRALDPLIGSTVTSVEVLHPGFVRPVGTPVDAFEPLCGHALTATRRHGKLLLLEIDDGMLGLRFGMTGMLFIDGQGPIQQLEYASSRQNPAWNRLTLTIGDSVVTVRDQRRLGSVELDPDMSRLGIEASTIGITELTALCDRRRRAIKSLLLDQSCVAGLGNLLVDEVLWSAGLAPQRRADSLTGPEMSNLASTICSTVADLSVRGGSNMGDSFPHRVAGASCPNGCGIMQHATIGGRSTWWCPGHQS